MKPAPMHPREQERLELLQSYGLLDTGYDEKFDRLTRMAANLTDSPIATFTLIDSDRQWFKSKVGLDDRQTPRETAFCAHAILDDGMLVVEDATKDERFVDNPFVTGEPGIRFYAGVPLVTKSGLGLGTLCIIDRKPRTLSDEQRRTLEDLAGMAVDEMELHRNLRLLRSANQRLEVMASTDGLTGIANRRAFDETLALELRRAARENAPLSLLLIDADQFKKFNDRYGHGAGDACLRAIAQVLQDSTRRPFDLAARYGGEEFALILPATDEEGAMRMAETVREGVAALGLEHADSPTGHVTVSIGVAAMAPRANAQADALIEAADGALYRAKAMGRNTSCSAAHQDQARARA